MNKPFHYIDNAGETIETLSKSAFMTTKYEDKTNTMTIAWGSIGFMWGKPVFMVMVRPSRYTHELIEGSGEFTVSIPRKDMQAALSFCGSQSGRNMDKICAAELELRPGQKVSTPVIANCGLHYECKVVYKQDMSSSALTPEYTEKWYPNDNLHTMYFGEIIASYAEEE